MQQKNTFNTLPPSIIKYLCHYLSPAEILQFSAVDKRVNRLVKENNAPVWEKKLKQHFPYVYQNLKKQQQIDWFLAFTQAYKRQYRNLSPAMQKLFSLIKEKDLPKLKESIQPKQNIKPFQSFLTTLKESIQLKNSISEVEDLLKYKDSDGHSLLFWLAYTQNQALMDYMYQKWVVPSCFNGISFNINKLNGLEENILYWAVAFNQPKDWVYELIQQGVDINQANHAGETSLYIAIKINCFYGSHYNELIQLLLTNGAHVNHTCQEGKTPLIVAAGNGDTKMVRLLLTHGAKVNQTCPDGASSLYIAVTGGYREMVKLLLNSGANVNQACHYNPYCQQCHYIETPLYVAAQKGYSDIVPLLLAHGADVKQACFHGKTSLHIAAQKGYSKIVDLLLAQGADVNKQSHNFETPGDIAAQYGHKQLAKRLYQQSLLTYIQDVDQRNDDHYKNSLTIFCHKFNFGYSARQKKEAALALLHVIRGQDDPSILLPHLGALTNGSLEGIYKGLLPFLKDIQSKDNVNQDSFNKYK